MAESIESVGGDAAPPPLGPYSPAVGWKNALLVSGLLPVNLDGSKVSGGIREETMIVLRNLKNLLESSGSGLEKVMSVTVFLADIDELPAFNEVYEEYFSPPYPARSVLGGSLPGSFRVELSAIAFR